MSTIINATTTNGVVIQPDNSGSLVLQTNNGTAALTIDTSQRAAFVAGTAALPAITTTGDTNTGIFFPAADTIAFAEGGTEAMRIDSSGNVGIGTTSPSSYASATRKVLSINNTDNVLTLGSYYELGIAQYSFINSSNVAGSGNIALVFSTGSNTERMRIDSVGRPLFNTTSALNAGYMSMLFDGQTYNGFTLKTSYATTGSVYLYFINSAGNVAGFVSQNGTTTVSYTTSSDYRLKENIVPMTGALDKVLQLKPVNYTWKQDGLDGQGFIAHELQAIVPDAVVGEKDAVDAEGNPKYQGIDTSFLVATLTAAIQEQTQIINDLKARIETLEAK